MKIFSHRNSPKSRGAALVEYVVLMAGISLLAVGAVRGLGLTVVQTFDVTSVSLSSSSEYATHASDTFIEGGSSSSSSAVVRNGGTINSFGEWCPPSSWSYNSSSMTYTLPGFGLYHQDSRHTGEVGPVFNQPGETFEMGTGNIQTTDWIGEYVRKRNIGNTHYWRLSAHLEGVLEEPGANC